jgi:hypothetical protein
MCGRYILYTTDERHVCIEPVGYGGGVASNWQPAIQSTASVGLAPQCMGLEDLL